MIFHTAQRRRLALHALMGVLAASGLTACDSITSLDESAQTFVSPDKFYQNDAQAAIAVNAVYAPLMSWNGWKQPAQHSIMCDDDQVACESWMGGGLEGMYGGQWYNQGNSVWFGNYLMIERANQVMHYVAASAGVSDAMKKKVNGQARFARAYAYFDLVRRYGAVPLRTQMYQPDDQMGAQARAPIADVWKQIVTDLRVAAADLPPEFDATSGQGVPRRAAAWGLLAKVYLHMAGAEVAGSPLAANKNTYLDSAAYAARQVMQDATVTLEAEYMDLFDPDKQNASREILFAVQGTRINQGGSNVVPFFSPAGDCTLTGGCGPAGPGFISLREDFVDSFSAGDKRMKPNYATPWAWQSMPQSQSQMGGKVRKVIHFDSLKVLGAAGLVADTTRVAGDGWAQACSVNRLYPGFYRLTLYTAPGATTTTVDTVAIPRAHFTLKYTDRNHTGSEYSNGNNFIILRYADVLLLLAEAINERGGPNAEAIAAVDAVRQRAGLQPLATANPAGIASEAAFRATIREERGRELYAEFQRRFDMLRWGIYLSNTEGMNRPVTNDFGTFSVCRPRQQFQLLQPIPNGELAANPLMTQNPGW